MSDLDRIDRKELPRRWRYCPELGLPAECAGHIMVSYSERYRSDGGWFPWPWGADMLAGVKEVS